MYKNFSLLLIAIVILAGEILPQKGVEVISPTVMPNVITDLVLIDKTTAIASGTLGSVMKTTDAGLTWQTLKSGEDIWFNSVAAAGTEHIWATGPNEFLVSSHDGGKSWKSEKIGKLAFLYKVQFFDANNGFVAGSAILSENQTEAIYQMYVTSDGGKTWNQKNASLGFFPMDMHFTSANEGFAIEKNNEKTGKDRFIKTSDGGKTWVDVKDFNDADLSTMSFPDSKNGFVIAEMPITKGDNPTSKLVVFNTADGGKTWKKSDFPVEVKSNMIKESHMIYFKSPKTGWVIKANELEGPVQNHVYKTDDGGKTWTKVYTSDETGVSRIAFFDENNGIMTPGFWYLEPKIFRTTDGGKTFGQLVKGTENHFHAFQFFDENRGFAVGENSIVKTVDGGKSWTVSKKVIGSMFDRIKFFNEKEGLATATDEAGFMSIFSTTDGGENWTATNLTYNGYLQELVFTDFKTFYAINYEQERRTVIKSEDGGKTWKETMGDYSPDGQLYDIFFLDKNTGWVTGVQVLPGATKNNGMVSYLKNTTDGGVTWSDTWLDDQMYPATIQFIDKNHGWYTSTVNDTSVVLWRTTDGGKKWIQSSLSSPWDIIEGLQFQDPLNGWMLKAYGAPLSPSFIYRTNDGGKTWNLFATVNKIEKLQFINDKTVYGGGYFNLIKFSID